MLPIDSPAGTDAGPPIAGFTSCIFTYIEASVLSAISTMLSV